MGLQTVSLEAEPVKQSHRSAMRLHWHSALSPYLSNQLTEAIATSLAWKEVSGKSDGDREEAESWLKPQWTNTEAKTVSKPIKSGSVLASLGCCRCALRQGSTLWF